MAAESGVFPVEDRTGWSGRRGMKLDVAGGEDGAQGRFGDLWKRTLGMFMTLPRQGG